MAGFTKYRLYDGVTFYSVEEMTGYLLDLRRGRTAKSIQPSMLVDGHHEVTSLAVAYLTGDRIIPEKMGNTPNAKFLRSDEGILVNQEFWENVNTWVLQNRAEAIQAVQAAVELDRTNDWSEVFYTALLTGAINNEYVEGAMGLGKEGSQRAEAIVEVILKVLLGQGVGYLDNYYDRMVIEEALVRRGILKERTLDLTGNGIVGEDDVKACSVLVDWVRLVLLEDESYDFMKNLFLVGVGGSTVV